MQISRTTHSLFTSCLCSNLSTRSTHEYGFIHKALEDLVLSAFGKEKWNAILEKAEVQYENGPFLSHSGYNDSITMKLILTTCQVLNLELDTALEVFGGHFLVYCQTNGYDRILRVLGGNMFDMLSNLDNLHDHLESQYPGIRAPSFKCSIDGDALILHYFSVRNGLEAIVRGLVKAIGKSFFQTEVNVTTHKDESDGHITLRITYNEDAEVKKNFLLQDKCVTRFEEKLPLSNKAFVQIFPFHLVLDQNMNIVQTGSVLRRLTNNFRKTLGSHPANFNDFFYLIRPKLSVSYDSFVSQVNQMYVVRTKKHVITGNGSDPVMKLKGQMLLLHNNQLMFLCSPRFQSTDDLEMTNLYFADIPIHDHCRDMLLLNVNRGDERELVQKLEEGSNKLKTLELELQDDKKRTDELLHSILPAKVADKLRLNLPVESETFDTVSALFSDIVGFTALCSSPNVKPINIVQMLSHLYTQFDELTHAIGVYKLETIGDAYIIVGSLPDFVDDHADRTVLMGLEMIKIIAKAVSPADGKPLQMRIGIHTGSVMAGVVGKMMPRYCCFGNMMTTANKMESNGIPMNVTISQVTKSHLTKNIYCLKKHKEVAEMDTYLISIQNEEDQPKFKISTITKQFSEVSDHENNGKIDSGKGKSLSSTSSIDSIKPSTGGRQKSRIPVAKKLQREPRISTEIARLPQLKYIQKIPSIRPSYPSHRCQATFPMNVQPRFPNNKIIPSKSLLNYSVKNHSSRKEVAKVPKISRSITLPPIQRKTPKFKTDACAISIEEIISFVGHYNQPKLSKTAAKL